MFKRLGFLFPLFAMACAGGGDLPADEVSDPENECVFCDDKADAFGIARDSYLAYGIVELANTATFDELDHLVPLDVRAARVDVARHPQAGIARCPDQALVAKLPETL